MPADTPADLIAGPPKPPRRRQRVSQPPDSATPLNARQELFCQALSRGMSKTGAYRAAGYKRSNPNRPLDRPNVRARYEALMAARAAQSEVTVAEITDGLRDLIAKTRDGETAALLAQTRQSYMDLAKLHGLLDPRAMAAALAPPPITKIRWVLVHPNGEEEPIDYGA